MSGNAPGMDDGSYRREVLEFTLGSSDERRETDGTVSSELLSWPCGCRARRDDGKNAYEVTPCAEHADEFEDFG